MVLDSPAVQSSQKGPDNTDFWSESPGPEGTQWHWRTITSPETDAYLGQLLGIGQIVHSDGQEHVQQRVWGDELRVGE